MKSRSFKEEIDAKLNDIPDLNDRLNFLRGYQTHGRSQAEKSFLQEKINTIQTQLAKEDFLNALDGEFIMLMKAQTTYASVYDHLVSLTDVHHYLNRDKTQHFRFTHTKKPFESELKALFKESKSVINYLEKLKNKLKELETEIIRHDDR